MSRPRPQPWLSKASIRVSILERLSFVRCMFGDTAASFCEEQKSRSQATCLTPAFCFISESSLYVPA